MIPVLSDEEREAIEEYKNKVSTMNSVSRILDRKQTYVLSDGTLTIQVDEVRERFREIGLEITINDDDVLNEVRKQRDYVRSDIDGLKVYGKREIMMILDCGSQKSLNFLKLMYQMGFAIKIGKSYYITRNDFDKFFEEYKGQEIAI